MTVVLRNFYHFGAGSSERLLRHVRARGRVVPQTQAEANGRRGSRAAGVAIKLADDPGRFLPTVQISITLIGVLAGAFSGATIARHIASWLIDVPGSVSSRRAWYRPGGHQDHLSVADFWRVGSEAHRTDGCRAGSGAGIPAIGMVIQLAHRPSGCFVSPATQFCGSWDCRGHDRSRSPMRRFGLLSPRGCRRRLRSRRTRHDRRRHAAG